MNESTLKINFNGTYPQTRGEIKRVAYHFQGAIDRNYLNEIVDEMNFIVNNLGPLGEWMDPNKMLRTVKFVHYPEIKFQIRDNQIGGPNGLSESYGEYYFNEGGIFKIR